MPGPPRSSDATRRGVLLLTLFAVLVCAWHASPLLLWHLSFEAQLAAASGPERLVAAARTLGTPASGWNTLRVANLSLRLPLLSGDEAPCAACGEACVLPLEDAGTLAVFDAAPPEDLGTALDRFSPDPRDLSLLRSVSRNWRTIDALTDRARSSVRPPDSFRFAGMHSQGVVSRFRVNGRGRFVVYAYGPGGESTRVLGVTGVTEERLDRILGGLAITARPADGTSATCL